MVSIKFSVVLLALVCLIHLKESSGFLVKRDTETPNQELSFDKLGEVLTNAFDEFKKKVTDPSLMESAKNQLQDFNKKLEEAGKNFKESWDQLSTDTQKPSGP